MGSGWGSFGVTMSSFSDNGYEEDEESNLCKINFRVRFEVHFWVLLGLFGIRLGSVWGPLGATMSSLSNVEYEEDEESNVNKIDFGVLWRSFGGPLEVLWGSFWGFLGAICKSHNLLKAYLLIEGLNSN